MLWSRALQGDLLDAARHIRILTHTEKYTFEHHCPVCNSMQRFTVDLLEDLDVVEFEPRDYMRFRNGQLFETVHEGRTVKFKAMRIEDELKLQRQVNNARNEESNLMLLFMMRIKYIEGFEDERNPHRAWQKWLESQHLGQLMELREAMVDVDPGLNTTVRKRCPKRTCGAEQEIDLPFATASFFLGNMASWRGRRHIAGDAGQEGSVDLGDGWAVDDVSALQGGGAVPARHLPKLNLAIFQQPQPQP